MTTDDKIHLTDPEQGRTSSKPLSPKRSLWDIAHPLEVAHSILIFHTDPMQELRRRVRYARKQENPEANIRFWAEVGAYLKIGVTYRWNAP
tara:strand:- start:1500 stop:1772 length:273 start_codon:yes stop_codon:yes gene_type:complete